MTREIIILYIDRTKYYRTNSMRANPEKTQITAFQLRKKKTKRSLAIAWNGIDLEKLLIRNT